MKFRIPAGHPIGRLLVSVTLLALGACNDDPIEPPDDIGGNVEGAWTAISFGGSPLPIQEFVNDPDRGVCLRVLDNVDLTFGASSQFTWVEEGTVECSGSAPEQHNPTFTGTYVVDGVNLTMTFDEGGISQQSTFSVRESTLTMNVRYGSTILTSVFQRS